MLRKLIDECVAIRCKRLAHLGGGEGGGSGGGKGGGLFIDGANPRHTIHQKTMIVKRRHNIIK